MEKKLATPLPHPLPIPSVFRNSRFFSYFHAWLSLRLTANRDRPRTIALELKTFNSKTSAMYHFVTSIRTCYADVDQMGFVYYGNYPKFYEIARTETIRSLGISYKEMEEKGVMMPVVEINLRYKRPAHYDEILSIHTFVKEIPQGPKMTFFHEVYNENGDLLNEGSVTLAFMRSSDHKPCRIPEFLKELLRPHFPLQAK